MTTFWGRGRRPEGSKGLAGIVQSIGDAYGAGQDEDLLKKLRKKQDTEKATSDIMSVYDQKMAPSKEEQSANVASLRGVGTHLMGPGLYQREAAAGRTEYEQSVREGLAGGGVDESTAAGAAIRAYERAHPGELVNVNEPNALKKVGAFIANMTSGDPRKLVLDLHKQVALEEDNFRKNAIEKAKLIDVDQQRELDYRKQETENLKAKSQLAKDQQDILTSKKLFNLAEQEIKAHKLGYPTKVKEEEIKRLELDREKTNIEIQKAYNNKVIISRNMMLALPGAVTEKLVERTFGPNGILNIFNTDGVEGISIQEASKFTRTIWNEIHGMIDDAIIDQKKDADSWYGSLYTSSNKPHTILAKIEKHTPGGTLDDLKRLVFSQGDNPPIVNDSTAVNLITSYEKSMNNVHGFQDIMAKTSHMFESVQGLRIGQSTSDEKTQKAATTALREQYASGVSTTLEAFVGASQSSPSPFTQILKDVFNVEPGTDEFELMFLREFLDAEIVDGEYVKGSRANQFYRGITDAEMLLFQGEWGIGEKLGKTLDTQGHGAGVPMMNLPSFKWWVATHHLSLRMGAGKPGELQKHMNSVIMEGIKLETKELIKREEELKEALKLGGKQLNNKGIIVDATSDKRRKGPLYQVVPPQSREDSSENLRKIWKNVKQFLPVEQDDREITQEEVNRMSEDDLIKAKKINERDRRKIQEKADIMGITVPTTGGPF